MSDIYSSRRRMLATLGVVTTGVVAGCSETTESGGTDSSTGTNKVASNTENGEVQSSSATSTTGEADYYVSTDGADGNTGSQDSPLATVSEGLNRAQPGETIRLKSGEYRESLFTVRDGEHNNPITIEGPADAVIRPETETYSVFTISHQHIHLRGITIDGLINPDQKYEDWRAWAANCIQINPASRADEGVEYIRGAVVEPAKAGNTRKALIQTARIRDAVIGGFEVIGPTGMKYDPRVANHKIGHIGEIVYVGSPADRYKDPEYPYDTPERTRNVRVHHIDNSAGYSHNECVEVKPGCTNVTIEYCTDRNAGHNTEGIAEPAIYISGNDCTIRWNDIGECPSPIGIDSYQMGGTEWGQNNEVYGNRIHGFAAGAINFREMKDVPCGPEYQRTLCGNEIERGDPPIEPWVPEANGFDGEVADRRGQTDVSIQVGAGPNGHAFDPAAVIVDPGATITWEWVDDSGAHYVVSRVRIKYDPDTIPDLIDDGTYSTSETLNIPQMKRYACYNHHDDGMRAAVIVAPGEDRYSYAMGGCDASIPDGDGIGHTGGDDPNT
jgi:halocyanin-like protein